MDHTKNSSFRPVPSPPLSYPTLLIIFNVTAVVLCYLIGVYDFNVLLAVPVVLLLYQHWEECNESMMMLALIRGEYNVTKQNALKDGETVHWVNFVLDKWWPCCTETVTNFVIDWIEPIIEKFKFPMIVESIRIMSFNTNMYRPKFSNLHLLQPSRATSSVTASGPHHKPDISHPAACSPQARSGESTVAFEVDVDFNVPKSIMKMRCKLGKGRISHHFGLDVESFHIKGRIRAVIKTNNSQPFPHVSKTELCFVSPPKPMLKCKVKILKKSIEVMNIAGLKQLMEKHIEIGLNKLLVFPSVQVVDFTPAPLPGNEWAQLSRDGLSEGVLKVTVEKSAQEELPQGSVSKETKHYCKLQLGSQVCCGELNSKSSEAWSSIFSFLVKRSQQMLSVKLKLRNKFCRNSVLATRVIPLTSLGVVGPDNEWTSLKSTEKKVQMTLSSVHLTLTLSYSPLPHFSLLKRTPELDHNLSDVPATDLIGPSESKASCSPHCLINIGRKTVLTTQAISSTSNPIWERGLELSVGCSRNIVLNFEVHISSTETLSSKLIVAKTQYIQHKLSLSSTKKPSSIRCSPALYVSVVYRPVKSVSFTRDSLIESIFTHNQSLNCLDVTTSSLNPTPSTGMWLGGSTPDLNVKDLSSEEPLVQDDTVI